MFEGVQNQIFEKNTNHFHLLTPHQFLQKAHLPVFIRAPPYPPNYPYMLRDG